MRLYDAIRRTIALFLMELACRISWQSFVEYVCDYGEFGYCPDCEHSLADEPRYYR